MFYPGWPITSVHMDFIAILKVVGPLAGLGFLATAIGSLFLAAACSGNAGDWTVFVLLFVAAAVQLFLAFFRNENRKLKIVLVVMALVCIIGGCACPALAEEFHWRAAYIDRLTMYFLILTGLIAMTTCAWHFVTGRIAPEAFEAAGLDAGQETLLYFVWALIVAFIQALIMALSSSYSLKALVNEAIAYSVGMWFGGAVLAAGLGMLVFMKGGRSEGASSVSTVTTPSVSEYDKIG